MTQISIGKEDIGELGIYKEDDVLVLGVRLVPQAQYDSLIFKIEAKRDQRFEMWGTYSEINARARMVWLRISHFIHSGAF